MEVAIIYDGKALPEEMGGRWAARKNLPPNDGKEVFA